MPWVSGEIRDPSVLCNRQVDYFHLSIVATGCPSERHLRRRLVVKGGSARIQHETTENSAWFFNVLAV